MALLKVEVIIYEPSFDINNGNYYDVSPFEPNKRTSIRYRCGCKSDSYYSTNSEFNRHIKNKTHIKWLETYKEPTFLKELKEYKIIIEEQENEIKRNNYQTKKIKNELEEELKKKDILLQKLKEEHNNEIKKNELYIIKLKEEYSYNLKQNEYKINKIKEEMETKKIENDNIINELKNEIKKKNSIIKKKEKRN